MPRRPLRDCLSCQPARTESCQQPPCYHAEQSRLPLKWVSENISVTSTPLSSTGERRHRGGGYGGTPGRLPFSHRQNRWKIANPTCCSQRARCGQRRWGAAGDRQGFVTKAAMLVAACPAARKGGCEGSGCLIASSALSDSPPQTSQGHAVSLVFLQETPRSNFPSRLDDEIERF